MRKWFESMQWPLIYIGLVVIMAAASRCSAQGRVPARLIEASPLLFERAGAEPGSEASPITQGQATTITLPFIANNYTPPVPVFGVQMDFATEERGLVKATAAAIRWVRLDSFPWDRIEPVRTDPPTYYWSVVDELSLKNARASGMEPIAIIHYTPSWAQALPGYSCGPIRQDALDEFAQFLQALVARYSAPPFSVRYWELWNEPDVDPSLVSPTNEYGCWGQIGDQYYGGRYFGEMLKIAFPAIKAVQPDAKVLVGGLLLDCDPENPPLDKDCASASFLEGILVAGGGPCFDILGFHAYSYYFEEQDRMANPNWSNSVTAVPEKAGFLRGVLADYGFESKSLMNTEAALLCSEGTSACWSAQARYMPRAYAEAYALGLQAQVHYKMIQGEHWYNTGLLWYDLNPKPAYYAYAAASEFLSGSTYEGPASGYPAGISGYRFERHTGLPHVDVLWSADGTTQAMTLPAGASAYNLYGNLFAFWGDIQIADEPVYIASP